MSAGKTIWFLDIALPMQPLPFQSRIDPPLICLAVGIALVLSLTFASSLAAASLTRSDQLLLNSIQENVQKQQIDPDDSACLEVLLRHYPQSRQVHLVTGEVLVKLGLEYEALEQFKLAGRQGIFSLRQEFYRRLQEEPKQAPELVWYVSRLFPHDAAVLYQEGLLCLKRQNIELARRKFVEAAHQPAPYLGAYAALSGLDLQAEHYAQAVENANKELNYHPDNYLSRRVRTIALWRQGASLQSLHGDLLILRKQSRQDQYVNFLLAAYFYKSNRFASACEPALLAVGQADNKELLCDSEKLLMNLSEKLPPGYLERFIDRVSPRGDKSIVATLLRLRMAEIYCRRGEHNAAKDQLSAAINMHPYLVATARLRLVVEQSEHMISRSAN